MTWQQRAAAVLWWVNVVMAWCALVGLLGLVALAAGAP